MDPLGFMNKASEVPNKEGNRILYCLNEENAESEQEPQIMPGPRVTSTIKHSFTNPHVLKRHLESC